MKIIRIAQLDPHDPDDYMGHYSIPELKDLANGFVKGYAKIEMEKHFDECPRCLDNYLTVKNNEDHKTQSV